MFMMQAVKRVFSAAAAAAALLLLLPPHANAQATLLDLRMGSVSTVAQTPILYALKSGIYKRYGINLEIVKMSNGSAAMAALIGGSVDISSAATFPTLIAISKGLPISLIGNLSNYVSERPDVALIVPADSPIKTAKDLEGRTLGVLQLQDQFMIATTEWLRQQRADPSKVKWVELPPAATLAALEQDRISAATAFEPFLSSFQSTGKVRVLGYPFDALAKRFSESVLFAGTKWATDNRGLIERFLQASQEGSVYVAAHEAETSSLVAEFAGSTAATNTSTQVHTPGRGVVIDPADIQLALNLLRKYNLIPNAMSARDIICNCALLRR